MFTIWFYFGIIQLWRSSSGFWRWEDCMWEHTGCSTGCCFQAETPRGSKLNDKLVPKKSELQLIEVYVLFFLQIRKQLFSKMGAWGLFSYNFNNFTCMVDEFNSLTFPSLLLHSFRLFRILILLKIIE